MKTPLFILRPAGTIDGGFVIVAAESADQAAQLANILLAPVNFWPSQAEAIPQAFSECPAVPCVHLNRIVSLNS